MRDAKATVQLAACGPERRIELRPRVAEGGGITLELHRDDCYFGPLVRVQLDEAQAFLRRWQAAVDEAYRRAKLEHLEHRRAVAR